MPPKAKKTGALKGASAGAKRDAGGQKQKGKGGGKGGRKKYNEANCRGNLCHGTNIWAAPSTVMSILSVWLDLERRPDPKIAATTDDFIAYIKKLAAKPEAGQGYAIAKISGGLTGVAQVLAGGNGNAKIGMKCSNLRMPNKRGAHIWLAESLTSSGTQYRGALLLTDLDIEALQILGILKRGSLDTGGKAAPEEDDVSFVAKHEETGISSVYYTIREAAQCINDQCFMPHRYRKKDVPIVISAKGSDYDIEGMMPTGDHAQISLNEKIEASEESEESDGNASGDDEFM